MANSFGKQIVTNGLVLCYDAANKRSYSGAGTSVTDLSSRGNTGTLINGVGFSANSGGAFVFDGVNDYGTFNSPVAANSQQTYEVWARAIPGPGAAPGSDFGYILHNNSQDQNIGVSFMTIGYAGFTLQSREIFACFSGAWQSMGTGVIADLLTTHQIVLTSNNFTQTVYVDGAFKKNYSLGAPANFSTITSLGDYRASTYRPIQGDIYNINIYNRALSAAEIQQNFQALRGRFGI